MSFRHFFIWESGDIYRRFLICSHDDLSLVIPNNKTTEHWRLEVLFIALCVLKCVHHVCNPVACQDVIMNYHSPFLWWPLRKHQITVQWHQHKALIPFSEIVHISMPQAGFEPENHEPMLLDFAVAHYPTQPLHKCNSI